MPENQNSDEVEQLRKRIAELEYQLERKRQQCRLFEEAALARFEKEHPYVPPTEEELRDLLNGPRGKPLLEVLDEADRAYYGEQGAPKSDG